MKTIGLLGGMSWESTLLYYRLINEGINERLGGLHSARLVMVSVDFAEIEAKQQAADWEGAARTLARAALQIEAAGADFFLICTNTMHKVAPEIEDAVGIPLVHIADATAKRINARGMHTVGLLGTRFTMEQAFYRGRLEREHGLEVLVPEQDEREIVHRVIYDELCRGQVREASREQFRLVIKGLRRRGAEAVIEGCTEIAMLVQQEHTAVPVFDTTAIHAEAAVAAALQ